jgi:hypothetical protein
MRTSKDLLNALTLLPGMKPDELLEVFLRGGALMRGTIQPAGTSDHFVLIGSPAQLVAVEAIERVRVQP